jgi:hypothetical protein
MRPLTVLLAATLVFLTGCSAPQGSNSSAAGGDAVARAPKAAPGDARGTESIRLTPAQAIVYTADLTMRAGDVPRSAGEAKRIVAAAGGYVSNENATEDPGSRPTATITFKIPSARYQGVLDQLGSSGIGARVSLRQQADDVTQEVADVDDIVQLEQEISTREADLESLQARQKSLSAQTAYATVTLRLEGTAVTHRGHKSSGGFAGGISAGWRAFTAFLRGLALVTGWALPFLGLAALIGVPVLWIRRRRRSAQSGTASP